MEWRLRGHWPKGSQGCHNWQKKGKLNETVSASPQTNEILMEESDVTDRKSLEELFQWFDDKFEIDSWSMQQVSRGCDRWKNSPQSWDKLIQTNLTKL